MNRLSEACKGLKRGVGGYGGGTGRMWRQMVVVAKGAFHKINTSGFWSASVKG